MKKLLTMLLCGIAVMAMVACSDADVPSEDEVRGEQTTKEDAEDKETVDEETADEETTDEEAKDEETKDDETTTDEETADVDESEEEDFALGKTDGLVYENAFIGLGCTLPSEWTFYSDEQIMELNNYTADVMGEEYEELMKSAQLVYDMYAVDGGEMNSINVTLEKIDNRMLAGIDVADIYAQNVPVFEEMYKGMGYSNVVVEQATFDIGGEDFAGIEISAEINGFSIYQKCFGVKCNGYLASIAITTYEEDNTDAVLSSFYLVD